MKTTYLIFVLPIIFYSCSKNDPVSFPNDLSMYGDSLAIIAGKVNKIDEVSTKAIAIKCQHSSEDNFIVLKESQGKSQKSEVKPGNHIVPEPNK